MWCKLKYQVYTLLFILFAGGSNLSFAQIKSLLPQGVTAVNNLVYFSAIDDSHGRELWKSDGTAAGTVLVKDMYPGSASSNPMAFTNVNGTLFFAVNISPDGFELWKSDGTSAGTIKLKDFKFIQLSNPDIQLNHVPIKLVAAGSTLFFTANNSAFTYDLWKSDGTAAGTIEVKKGITVAQAPVSTSRISPELVNVNGILYFFGDSGKQLWKSDGTTPGTVLVKDGFVNDSFTNEEFIYHPLKLTSSGGNLYFTYGSKANGRELWKSDGTAAGTVLVKDITPGSEYFTGSTDFRSLHDLSGVLYFVSSVKTAGAEKNELWKSNGTAAGTVLVKDLGSTTNAYDPYIESIESVGKTLFFTIKNNSYGKELWKSDGTAAGTKLVKDLLPGSASSSPEQLANANGVLFFVAKDGKKKAKIWKSKGKSEDTIDVK
jgi:ELWxxDGT repeat protein